MAFKGINIYQTTDRLVFRAFLQGVDGSKVITGTTNLYLFELQSDGTFKSYDFDTDTFKTTALTTGELAMTHQTGDNSTFDTGIWTVALTTLTGFTRGNIYEAQISNTGASPFDQTREFQFGGMEGDMIDGIAGTVNDAGATTTSFIGNSALSSDNDAYNGGFLVPLSGTHKGVPRKISDYVGATRTFQFNGAAGAADAAWPSALADTTPFLIIGRHGA